MQGTGLAAMSETKKSEEGMHRVSVLTKLGGKEKVPWHYVLEMLRSTGLFSVSMFSVFNTLIYISTLQ